MRIGDLRERVTITEATANTDAMGQRIVTYGEPFTRWAKVEQQQQGETQNFEGTSAKRRIVVTLRNQWVGGKLWRESMRVGWRSLTWDVVAIRELDPERTWLELIAEVQL